jgi:hypothetical protein
VHSARGEPETQLEIETDNDVVGSLGTIAVDDVNRCAAIIAAATSVEEARNLDGPRG